MKVKLSLERADRSLADIVVTTSATATVGEVARQIALSDPAGPARTAGDPEPLRTLAVHRSDLPEPEVLAPGRPFGEAFIGSGTVVRIEDLDPSRDWSRHRRTSIEATLEVIAGPDRGARFVLDAQSSYIGRDADCEVVLSDAMVSKRHARVELDEGVLTLIDDNSANGILVDGGQVPRIDLFAGARFTLGRTEFEIVSILQSRVPAAPTSREGGTVLFNRSPRVDARFEGERLEGPALPTDDLGQGFPFLMLIAPLILGSVLYLVTQNILSIVFIGLSPLLIIGNYLNNRNERKRKRKDQIARFEEAIAKLDAKLDRLGIEEGEARRIEMPSLAETVTAVETRGELFWTRRPEHWSFLAVRLGLGTARSRTEVNVRPPGERALAGFEERVDQLVERHRDIPDVPIIEGLDLAGGLGVCGPLTSAFSYVRGVVAQVAALHSPAEVVLTAFVEARLAGEFDWIKWLPHTSSAQSPLDVPGLADNASSAGSLVAALEALVERRAPRVAVPGAASRPALPEDETIDERGRTAGAGDPEERELPAVIVLVVGDPPVDRGRLVQVLERAVDVGVHPVWLARSRGELPALCRTFVEVAVETGTAVTAGFVREGRTAHPLQVEGLDASRAGSFARVMARVVDISAFSPDESDLPPSVSFLSLVGAELAEDGAAVVDRWRQNESVLDRSSATPTPRSRPGRLRALVGQAGADAMHLDLRTHGPHALVGGTTGAGKSEFLQAWVLGMATEYSPDRVTFLFVDYKGGAAFAECINLPHAVGLVTDLNTHLVRRALTSLRAELHHREHLLNRRKAKDLLELERRGDPECPPALVIVIDEFAALAGEIPEFVDGVVDVAQRGRSLGIHLIMATQRPAGVIRDNLRANTNLRVALRMADEADSADVVGTPLAAGFDPALPGRGIAKTGPGRLTLFQTAYAGGWTTEERVESRVDIESLDFGGGRPWEPPAPTEAGSRREQGPNDTARLVRTFRTAAELARIPAPRKPWLDELAPIYDLALLRQRTDTDLVLGVADDPAHQSQHPVYFRPDTDGHLAVYGAGGAGKTTVLRSIAIAAAITPRGGPVQVFGLDFGAGGLRALEDLAHVGSIVSGDDAERVARLLRWLRSVIDDRVTRFGAVRAGSISEYRTLANAPEEARLLLLVDGFAAFRQEYEFATNGQLFGLFQQILADGRQVGVHVVASADRPGSVSPAVASALQRRVILRLADENDYLLLDAAPDILTAVSPPGRAVVDGLETQIAVFGGSQNLADQSRAIEDLDVTLTATGRAPAVPIQRLSDDIPMADLPPMPGLVAIGVADDDLAPVGIEPEGVLMLTGPPQSGRSTALLTLVQAVHGQVPGAVLTYFGGPRSPVGRWEGWSARATDPESAGALARELLAEVSTPAEPGRRQVIVLESIADFLSTGADTDLAALIKAAKRNEHFVIAESETSSWSQSWPLLMEVKSARRGLALQPDQLEGDLLFKTAFPRARRSDFPPGRGYLVQAGRIRKIQLAYAE